MSKLPTYNEYDVVIIGSGMGGLTAGALLSRAGLRVCILEKQAIPGGYLMGFQRQRFRFDTAVHWLNQCMPGGITHTVWEMLGSDYPTVTPQQRMKRFIGEDFDYLLTQNPDELMRTLQDKFPHERQGIARFFCEAKSIGASFVNAGSLLRTNDTRSFWEKIKYLPKAIIFAKPFLRHVFYTGDAGVKKGLNRYFKDERLHHLFASEPDMLSCIIPIAWAYVGDYQNPPTGGGQSFVEWLAHVYRSMGNEICYHANVQQVLVEKNRAVGVRFDHLGQQVELRCKYVLAANDVLTLYEKMLPAGTVPPAQLDKLKAAELYSSSLTVWVALSCPAAKLGFHEEMIFISRQDVVRAEHISGDPTKSEIIILAPSHRDPSMAPAGNGTITIFMPAEIHQHNYWKAEKNEAGEWIRGAAYRQCKKEIAEILIDRVAQKVAPELRQHILFYEVATPITHQRYSGNYKGTMMGARPGKANFQAGVAHYKTPVANVFLSGHWAELGGGIPIAVKAGLNAALLVLKEVNRTAFALFCQYLDRKMSAEEIRNHPALKKYLNNWERHLTPAEMLANRRKETN